MAKTLVNGVWVSPGQTTYVAGNGKTYNVGTNPNDGNTKYTQVSSGTKSSSIKSSSPTTTTTKSVSTVKASTPNYFNTKAGTVSTNSKNNKYLFQNLNAQTLLNSSKSLNKRNNDEDDNNNYGAYSEYYGGVIPNSAITTVPKYNPTGVTLGSALKNAFANTTKPASTYNEYAGTYDNNIQSAPVTGTTLGSSIKNAIANNEPLYKAFKNTSVDNIVSPTVVSKEPTVVPTVSETPEVPKIPEVPEVPVTNTNVTDENKPIVVNGVGDKTYDITKNSDKVKNVLTGITDPEKLDKMMAWINIDNYMVGNTPITNAQNLYSADKDGSLALALRQQGFSDDEMNAIVAGMYEHYGTTKTAEKRISEGGTKSVEDLLAEIYNQNKANNQVNYNQTRSDVKNLLANSASNIDSQSAANRIASFREMQNSTGPDQDIGLKYLSSLSTAGADAMNNRANLSDKEIELYNYINNAQNAGQELDLSYLQTLANYAANKDYQATLGASNLAGVRYNANMNNYMNNNNLNAANQQTNASFSQLMQMINSGVNDPIQLIYKAMQSGLSYADAVALLTNYGVISST